MPSHFVDIFDAESKLVFSYPISLGAAPEAAYKSEALRCAVEDGEILERDVPFCSIQVRRAPYPEPFSWD